MLVIRPINIADLNQLVELASMTSFGLTTLPKDRELLSKRIAASHTTFGQVPQSPGGETYLFVMEETENAAIVGTSAIVSKTGGFEPFYAYRLETQIHESKVLDVRRKVRTLHLVTEHDGPCEIGSLFLRPGHRRGGNGRLLSLCRFLFMAEFPQLFESVVVAEMRGVIDERGHSKFWNALGRHFFGIDFPDADYFSVVNKKFIAELMPTHPIYVNLLPPDAQTVIAQVHDRTRPALRMLESEGFRFADLVDIFEAGPILRCPLKEIRTVARSIKAEVKQLEAMAKKPDESKKPQHVISNSRYDFRACLGTVHLCGEGVQISAAAAKALHVQTGDLLRYVTLR